MYWLPSRHFLHRVLLTSWICVINLAVVLGMLGKLARDAQGNEVREPAATAQAEDLFLAKVGPLLREKCLGCHGDDPQKLRGKFDVRSREAMLRGGLSGEPAVVPGQPEDSPLYLAVTRHDPDLAMPPKENDKLAVEDVAAFRTWIEGGAAWPSSSPGSRKPAAPPWDAAGGVTVATSGGLSPEWTNRRYKPEDLWAFQPLRKPAIPTHETTAAVATDCANPIDAFLDVKRVELGPAPHRRPIAAP